MSLFSALTDCFAKPGSTEGPEEASRREAARHTVLLVDDDKEFLDSCAAFLRDAGYNVLKSSTGAKGLNMLRYAPKNISAVLLDYDMPQLNGEETLQFLRKISPQIKVGAVSGLDESLLPASFRDHVERYLPKPFRREELLQFVHELLTATKEAAVAAPSTAS